MPSRNMQGHSQEVERMRGLLAQLESAQRERAHVSQSLQARPASPIQAAPRVERPPSRFAASTPVYAVATAGAFCIEISKSDEDQPQPRVHSLKNGPCEIRWSNKETAESGMLGPIPACAVKSLDFKASYRSIDDLRDALQRHLEQAAFDRVVSYASARERSSGECLQKLQAEGFARDSAASAIDRAQRYAIVDDLRYAEAFIASKVRAGWGERRVTKALAEHGVSTSIIPDYPQKYFGDSDSSELRAKELLAKRPIPAKQSVEKFARFLINRGFEVGVAFRAARDSVAERTDSVCDE